MVGWCGSDGSVGKDPKKNVCRTTIDEVVLSEFSHGVRVEKSNIQYWML